MSQEFGSLNNMMSAAAVIGQPAPEVGMGVTILSWTDRHAGTISRVSASGKTFWYRDDDAERVDANGMSECQEYEYTPRPDISEAKVTLRKDGRWKEQGGRTVQLGSRRAYHDYSF